MNKKMKLVLLASSISAITTPLLAVSCGNKSERAKFEDEIAKIDKLTADKSVNAEIRVKLLDEVTLARKDLNKQELKDEDLKKAKEFFLKNVELIKQGKDPIKRPEEKTEHKGDRSSNKRNKTDINKVITELKDILEISSNDSSKLEKLIRKEFDLYFSHTDNNIVAVEKGKRPNWKDIDSTSILFKVKDEYSSKLGSRKPQLVNDKKPTYERDGKTRLSSKIDYEIKKVKEEGNATEYSVIFTYNKKVLV